MSSVPGRPDALLVKAEPPATRDAVPEPIIPEDAVPSSREYEVTYKVQCLVRRDWSASVGVPELMTRTSLVPGARQPMEPVPTGWRR